MDLSTLRRRAKIMGIDIRKMKKAELVRAIQTREGYTPCFGTVEEACDELHCTFRADCLGKRAHC